MTSSVPGGSSSSGPASGPPSTPNPSASSSAVLEGGTPSPPGAPTGAWVQKGSETLDALRQRIQHLRQKSTALAKRESKLVSHLETLRSHRPGSVGSISASAVLAPTSAVSTVSTGSTASASSQSQPSSRSSSPKRGTGGDATDDPHTDLESLDADAEAEDVDRESTTIRAGKDDISSKVAAAMQKRKLTTRTLPKGFKVGDKVRKPLNRAQSNVDKTSVSSSNNGSSSKSSTSGTSAGPAAAVATSAVGTGTASSTAGGGTKPAASASTLVRPASAGSGLRKQSTHSTGAPPLLNSKPIVAPNKKFGKTVPAKVFTAAKSTGGTTKPTGAHSGGGVTSTSKPAIKRVGTGGPTFATSSNSSSSTSSGKSTPLKTSATGSGKNLGPRTPVPTSGRPPTAPHSGSRPPIIPAPLSTFTDTDTDSEMSFAHSPPSRSSYGHHHAHPQPAPQPPSLIAQAMLASVIPSPVALTNANPALAPELAQTIVMIQTWLTTVSKSKTPDKFAAVLESVKHVMFVPRQSSAHIEKQQAQLQQLKATVSSRADTNSSKALIGQDELDAMDEEDMDDIDDALEAAVSSPRHSQTSSNSSPAGRPMVAGVKVSPLTTPTNAAKVAAAAAVTAAAAAAAAAAPSVTSTLSGNSLQNGGVGGAGAAVAAASTAAPPKARPTLISPAEAMKMMVEMNKNKANKQAGPIPIGSVGMAASAKAPIVLVLPQASNATAAKGQSVDDDFMAGFDDPDEEDDKSKVAAPAPSKPAAAVPSATTTAPMDDEPDEDWDKEIEEMENAGPALALKTYHDDSHADEIAGVSDQSDGDGIDPTRGREEDEAVRQEYAQVEISQNKLALKMLNPDRPGVRFDRLTGRWVQDGPADADEQEALQGFETSDDEHDASGVDDKIGARFRLMSMNSKLSLTSESDSEKHGSAARSEQYLGEFELNDALRTSFQSSVAEHNKDFGGAFAPVPQPIDAHKIDPMSTSVPTADTEWRRTPGRTDT